MFNTRVAPVGGAYIVPNEAAKAVRQESWLSQGNGCISPQQTNNLGT